MTESEATPAAQPEETAQDQIAPETAQETPEAAVEQQQDPTPAEQPNQDGDDLQRQIKGLQRAQYEERVRRRQAEQQVAEMQQHLQQQQVAGIGGEMPKLSDFDYDENAYAQAVQSWNQQQWQNLKRQEQVEAERRDQLRREAEAQAQLQEAYALGQEKHPDFLQKVLDPSLPKLAELSPVGYQTLMEMDRDTGVDVAYYLANNPSELFEIAQLQSPIQAIRRMVEIEGRVRRSNAAKAGAQQPLSPPPSTVGGSSEASKDPNAMSMDEWMAWRNAQVYKQ